MLLKNESRALIAAAVSADTKSGTTNSQPVGIHQPRCAPSQLDRHCISQALQSNQLTVPEANVVVRRLIASLEPDKSSTKGSSRSTIAAEPESTVANIDAAPAVHEDHIWNDIKLRCTQRTTLLQEAKDPLCIVSTNSTVNDSREKVQSMFEAISPASSPPPPTSLRSTSPPNKIDNSPKGLSPKAMSIPLTPRSSPTSAPNVVPERTPSPAAGLAPLVPPPNPLQSLDSLLHLSHDERVVSKTTQVSSVFNSTERKRSMAAKQICKEEPVSKTARSGVIGASPAVVKNSREYMRIMEAQKLRKRGPRKRFEPATLATAAAAPRAVTGLAQAPRKQLVCVAQPRSAVSAVSAPAVRMSPNNLFHRPTASVPRPSGLATSQTALRQPIRHPTTITTAVGFVPALIPITQTAQPQPHPPPALVPLSSNGHSMQSLQVHPQYQNNLLQQQIQNELQQQAIKERQQLLKTLGATTVVTTQPQPPTMTAISSQHLSSPHALRINQQQHNNIYQNQALLCASTPTTSPSNTQLLLNILSKPPATQNTAVVTIDTDPPPQDIPKAAFPLSPIKLPNGRVIHYDDNGENAAESTVPAEKNATMQQLAAKSATETRRPSPKPCHLHSFKKKLLHRYTDTS